MGILRSLGREFIDYGRAQRSYRRISTTSFSLDRSIKQSKLTVTRKKKVAIISICIQCTALSNVTLSLLLWDKMWVCSLTHHSCYSASGSLNEKHLYLLFAWTQIFWEVLKCKSPIDRKWIIDIFTKQLFWFYKQQQIKTHL